VFCPSPSPFFPFFLGPPFFFLPLTYHTFLLWNKLGKGKAASSPTSPFFLFLFFLEAPPLSPPLDWSSVHEAGNDKGVGRRVGGGSRWHPGGQFISPSFSLFLLPPEFFSLPHISDNYIACYQVHKGRGGGSGVSDPPFSSPFFFFPRSLGEMPIVPSGMG